MLYFCISSIKTNQMWKKYTFLQISDNLWSHLENFCHFGIFSGTYVPAFPHFSMPCIDVDQGSLINKKLKNSLGLRVFCGGCANLMPFSTNLCKKSILPRTERFGRFLFCVFYSNLGLPNAKSLQNERLVLVQSAKIEPVTTHKMASYLLYTHGLITTCLIFLHFIRFIMDVEIESPPIYESFAPHKDRAGNHPQNGFLSDGYDHNLSGKHVFDRS